MSREDAMTLQQVLWLQPMLVQKRCGIRRQDRRVTLVTRDLCTGQVVLNKATLIVGALCLPDPLLWRILR
jgi:hypothetical protein